MNAQHIPYLVRRTNGEVEAAGTVPDTTTLSVLQENHPGRLVSWIEHEAMDALFSALSLGIVVADEAGVIASIRPFVDPRTEKRRQADALRDQKLTALIPYRGAMFDADATAIRNISGWQTQIAAGVTLPPGFVWRDADNIDHPADADFINGLGAAITLRGSLLYQAAWAHKANIDALPDHVVEMYDVTASWPV